MPYATELTTDFLGVVHTGTGVVSGEEILVGCRSVLQLIQITENFHYELVDLSAASEVQINREQLDEMVTQGRLAAFYRPRATVVIIVPNERVLEIARQWETAVSQFGWQTFVSRDREVALRWLSENFHAPEEETASVREHF